MSRQSRPFGRSVCACVSPCFHTCVYSYVEADRSMSVLMLLFLDREHRRSRSGMSYKVQECLWHLNPGGCYRWTSPLTGGQHLPLLLHQSEKATHAHVSSCDHTMCWCWCKLVSNTRLDNSSDNDKFANWKGQNWSLSYTLQYFA